MLIQASVLSEAMSSGGFPLNNFTSDFFAHLLESEIISNEKMKQVRARNDDIKTSQFSMDKKKIWHFLAVEDLHRLIFYRHFVRSLHKEIFRCFVRQLKCSNPMTIRGVHRFFILEQFK